MAAFSVRIEGLKELQAKLSDLSDKTQKRIVRRALRDGARPMQAAITEAAPTKTEWTGGMLPEGALKLDIEVHITTSEEGNPAITIGPGKHTTQVAGWVEYGHNMVTGGKRRERKGKITGKGKLTKVGGGKTFVPAQPFIRPAYESTAEESIATICLSLAQGIEKEAHK